MRLPLALYLALSVLLAAVVTAMPVPGHRGHWGAEAAEDRNQAPPEWVRTIAVHVALAEFHKGNLDFTSAADEYAKVFDEIRQAGAESTAFSITMQIRYADFLREIGRPAVAESQLRTALDIAAKSYPTSRQHGAVLTSLARLMELEGRLLSARHFYQRAATVEKATSTPDGARLVAISNRIDAIDNDLKAWLAATPPGEQRRAASDILALLDRIPATVETQGVREAYRIAGKAYAIAPKALDAGHPYRLLTAAMVWELDRPIGRNPAEANAVFGSNLKLANFDTAPDLTLLGRLHMGLAAAYQELGDSAKTLDHFTYCVSAYLDLTELSPTDRESDSTCLSYVAPVWRDKKKYGWATVAYDRLTQQNERRYGPEAKATLESRNLFAWSLVRYGVVADAERQFRMVFETVMKPDSEPLWKHVYVSATELALICLADKRKAESLEILERALSRMREIAAPEEEIAKLQAMHAKISE